MCGSDNLKLSWTNTPAPRTLRCVSLCPNYGPRLVLSVLEAMREASAAASWETHACVRIQSAIRMWLQRTVYLMVRSSIIHIQRFYRGYRARKRLAVQLVEAEKAYCQAIFDYYSTRIQACFRGYYCRQHISNYYAMKRYVIKVVQESDRVQCMAESVQVELKAQYRIEADEADAAAYRCATERAHHLLSTTTIPGVYGTVRCASGSPKSTMENGTLTAIWNTSVEDDIKANNSRLIRSVVQQRQQKPSNISGALSLSKTKCASNGIPRFIHNKDQERDNKSRKGLKFPALTGPCVCPTNSEAHATTVKSDANEERAARAHYYRQCFKPSTRAQVMSCSYEREDTHPPDRPLMPPQNLPSSQLASSLAKSVFRNAENGQSLLKKGDAARTHLTKYSDSFDDETENKLYLLTARSPLAPQNAVSSHNRKFRVPAHSCFRDIDKQTDNSRDVGVGGTDLYIPNKPIYDTEKETLRRIVDMKVIHRLHRGVPFKVSTVVSNETKTSALWKSHTC
ncbi:unnamed protein product [Phytomonas sp. EM1]|nr:unnamed protein product [Phytomonas sp. EM1]|eukprot:CCW61196.1 unnamed protein product [Phytomonas sp. isolate EM1]